MKTIIRILLICTTTAVVAATRTSGSPYRVGEKQLAPSGMHEQVTGPSITEIEKLCGNEKKTLKIHNLAAGVKIDKLIVSPNIQHTVPHDSTSVTVQAVSPTTSGIATVVAFLTNGLPLMTSFIVVPAPPSNSKPSLTDIKRLCPSRDAKKIVLAHPPACATVTWAFSSNVDTVSTSKTHIIIQPKVGTSGTGWVEAQFSNRESLREEFAIVPEGTPVLSELDQICPDIKETLTLSHLPAGDIVTWSFSPQVSITPDPDTHTKVTIKLNDPNSSGAQWVKATTGCGVVLEEEFKAIPNPSNPSLTDLVRLCFGKEEQITLSNLPVCATVEWSSSDHVTIVSGQNTPTLTITPASASSSGTGWVTAKLNNGKVLKEEFTVIPKADLVLTAFEPTCPLGTGTLTLKHLPEGETVTWESSDLVSITPKPLEDGTTQVNIELTDHDAEGAQWVQATTGCGVVFRSKDFDAAPEQPTPLLTDLKRLCHDDGLVQVTLSGLPACTTIKSWKVSPNVEIVFERDTTMAIRPKSNRSGRGYVRVLLSKGRPRTFMRRFTIVPKPSSTMTLTTIDQLCAREEKRITLRNLPRGETITWSSSPDLSLTPDPDTQTRVTIQLTSRYARGERWVKATPSCGKEVIRYFEAIPDPPGSPYLTDLKRLCPNRDAEPLILHNLPACATVYWDHSPNVRCIFSSNTHMSVQAKIGASGPRGWVSAKIRLSNGKFLDVIRKEFDIVPKTQPVLARTSESLICINELATFTVSNLSECVKIKSWEHSDNVEIISKGNNQVTVGTSEAGQASVTAVFDDGTEVNKYFYVSDRPFTEKIGGWHSYRIRCGDYQSITVHYEEEVSWKWKVGDGIDAGGITSYKGSSSTVSGVRPTRSGHLLIEVQASNKCGESGWLPITIQAYCDRTPPNPWSDPWSDPQFDAYPNPASSVLNIAENGESTTPRPLSEINPASYPQTATYELIDAQLEVVARGNIEGLATIDVSRLTKGAYVLKIRTEQGEETHRIIIQ